MRRFSSLPLPDESPTPADRPLTLPIPVASHSLPSAACGLLLACAAFVLIILFVRFVRNELVAPWEWLWLAIPIGVAGWMILDWLSRQWLEIGREGFSIGKRGGKRLYLRDEQVSEITWQKRASFEFGFSAQRYDVMLRVERPEGALRLVWCYRNVPEAPYALAPFVARLIEGLAQRTLASLQTGGRLAGDGWYLDAQGLHHHRQVIPVQQLSVWGVLYGRLRIYRAGQSEPWLTLSAQGRNVYVLERLLQQVGHPAPATDHPLGRHLASRNNWDWLALLIAPGYALLAILFGLVAYYNGPKLWGFFVLATICGLIMLVCLWLGWKGWRSRLEFYDQGVKQPRCGRSLRYEQLACLQANRSLSRLNFQVSDARQLPIRFWTNLGRYHPDHGRLLRWIATPLAQRCLQDLRTAGILVWTNRLIFHRDGLEIITPATWWGQAQVHRVTYNALAVVEGDYGVQFFEVPSSRVLGAEWYSKPNFFVGLLLLEWLSVRPDLATATSEPQDPIEAGSTGPVSLPRTNVGDRLTRPKVTLPGMIEERRGYVAGQGPTSSHEARAKMAVAPRSQGAGKPCDATPNLRSWACACGGHAWVWVWPLRPEQ